MLLKANRWGARKPLLFKSSLTTARESCGQNSAYVGQRGSVRSTPTLSKTLPGCLGNAGTDALEAQRKRKQRLTLDEYNRLSGKGSAKSAVVLPDGSGRITLAAAAEKYFANCEARGLNTKSIRKYRAAVDPFVEHCGVTYVDEPGQ